MTELVKNEQRILIVDDTLSIIQFIGSVLRDEGFLINIAENGTKALEVVKEYFPDLILLDINMPGIDGYETCKRLKSNKKYHDIPVIFLSAYSDSSDKVKGFKLGAVDYITKPIDPQELLARINTHLTISMLQKQLAESNKELEDKVKLRTKDLIEKNEELASLKKRFQIMVETIDDLIWEINENFQYTYISPKVENLLGYKQNEMLGNTPFSYMPHEESIRVKQKYFEMKENKQLIKQIENIYIHKNGSYILIETSVLPIYDDNDLFKGCRGVDRDITEKKKIEEVMIQTEKMMSVGGLAAGMAHEINNPLAGIIQNIQVMQTRLLEDLPINQKIAEKNNLSLEDMHKYVKERKIDSMISDVSSSVQRAAGIVRNMLSFAKKDLIEKQFCSIAELLDTTIDLASNDYDLKKKYDFRQIKIIKNYQDDLPEVMCEPGKIQQVFLNILKNGSEAMQDKSDPGYNPQFDLNIYHDKEYVTIEIKDNGPGINKQTRSRIFEPFFTTKKYDNGTGLGMSVSHFIITDNHKGKISVESEEGEGAKFIIKLPLSAG